jgi:hypothetical protein
MSKTALLHIGTRKTGTTSIQQVLAETAKVDSTFSFPLMNGDHNQNRLVTVYLPHSELPVHWRHAPEACQRYRRFVLKELATARNAVISAEALSAYFNTRAAEQLRDDLERIGFRRFHVILYVRDPADYFLSFLQQILKSSDQTAPIGSHPASFRYGLRHISETWEHAFPGCVEVRKFPDNPPTADVTQDFSALVQEHLGVSLPVISTRMNATISAEAMQIIQDYRLAFWPDNGGIVTPDTTRLVRFLEASMAEVPQNKPVLKPAVRACIRANHQLDGDFIYSRYGVDLGLTETQPVQFELDRSYRVGDLVESLDPEIVRELLLRLAKSEMERAPAKRSLARRVASRAVRAVRF